MKSQRIIRLLLYVLTPVLVFILSTYFTISLVLKTQQTTVCPDVRGRTVDEARVMVRTSGLSLSVLRYERRNDVPYNHITIQKPEANINTRKGRIVYVIVSEGPELLKTPGFVGQSLEDAQVTLQEKKLTLEKIISVPHTRGGKVLAQIPAEGTEVLEQSGVTLIVGEEPKAYYLLPDTRNMNPGDLTDEMDAKKIKYKTNYVRDDRAARGGFDISVAPRTIFTSADEITINLY
ncbi:MAG TPA: PASTA domain-containing protein [Syntrophorhabdaceae bacterium]|nr:PASTA domain-containing protein [Syntrophorhabdaceae bacterium]